MTKDRISNTYEDDPKNLKLNAFNLFRENVFNDACTSSEKCQVRSLLLVQLETAVRRIGTPYSYSCKICSKHSNFF